MRGADMFRAITIHEKKVWTPIGSRLEDHSQMSIDVIMRGTLTKNATMEVLEHHLNTFSMSLEDAIRCFENIHVYKRYN